MTGAQDRWVGNTAPTSARLKFGWALLASSLLTSGCVTGGGGGGDTRTQVALSETRLQGEYTLVDYLFEYGDGLILNDSILKIQGTLSIKSDSSYWEHITVSDPPTDTKGKITHLWIDAGSKTGGNQSGQLGLTLDDSTGKEGVSTFAFHQDTLVLITDVPAAQDARKKGFRETAYYQINSAVK